MQRVYCHHHRMRLFFVLLWIHYELPEAVFIIEIFVYVEMIRIYVRDYCYVRIQCVKLLSYSSASTTAISLFFFFLRWSSVKEFQISRRQIPSDQIYHQSNAPYYHCESLFVFPCVPATAIRNFPLTIPPSASALFTVLIFRLSAFSILHCPLFTAESIYIRSSVLSAKFSALCLPIFSSQFYKSFVIWTQCNVASCYLISLFHKIFRNSAHSDSIDSGEVNFLLLHQKHFSLLS